MATARYIDFISSYCDRWCERCRFTERCSAFAAQRAIEMCGNEEDGLELALGPVHCNADTAEEQVPAVNEHMAMATTASIESCDRARRERHARIDASPIARLANAYALLAYRWLQAHPPVTDDPVVAEAIRIVSWDHMFITVKLHRALSGHDEHVHGEFPEPHPVQADFNGSAKVVLISIERSEAAWRAIASVAGSEAPLMFADQLAQLRDEVENAFPHARAFIRPGFDAPAKRTESGD